MKIIMMKCGGCQTSVEIEVIHPEINHSAILHEAFLFGGEADMQKCPNCGMQWGFTNARPKQQVAQ